MGLLVSDEETNRLKGGNAKERLTQKEENILNILFIISLKIVVKIK